MADFYSGEDVDWLLRHESKHLEQIEREGSNRDKGTMYVATEALGSRLRSFAAV